MVNLGHTSFQVRSMLPNFMYIAESVGMEIHLELHLQLICGLHVETPNKVTEAILKVMFILHYVWKIKEERKKERELSKLIFSPSGVYFFSETFLKSPPPHSQMY